MFTKDSNLKSSMDRKLASIHEKKKKKKDQRSRIDDYFLKTIVYRWFVKIFWWFSNRFFYDITRWWSIKNIQS